MTYPLTFLVEVLVAVAVAAVSIAILRERRRLREAELSAGYVAPIGSNLAEEFAKYLEQGLILCRRHRDGCGIGLRFAEGKFVYGHATDGELPTPSEFVEQRWNDDERREFLSADEFVAWLAIQSSSSLAMAGEHQRLTKDRIEMAIEYCRKNRSSNWANYNG